jgi:hypothetical protein
MSSLRRVLAALLCTALLAGIPVAGGATAQSLCEHAGLQQSGDPGCCGSDPSPVEACPVACLGGSAGCVLAEVRDLRIPGTAALHFAVSAVAFAVHASAPDTAPPKTFVA